MSIPTVNVTVIVNGQDGLPVEGALVSAKLDREDRYNGFVVKKTVSGKTDATGTLVLPLWPNALGTNSSQYLVNIRTKEQTKRYTAYVPNENCVLTSIVDLEPAPALSVAQIVLRDANEARVRVEAAVAEAGDFADAASAAAVTAGAASDAAGGYASAAEASAEGAAAAVDGVVESVADLAAGASASAAAAEAAAEAAAISAEQAASVSDITSHAGTTASVAVLGHVMLASAAPAEVSSTAATGVASTVARSDHAHALGAHAASHAAGQPDAISPASIGAASASHVSDTANPHGVTLAQVGAAPASHALDTANPHSVTAAQAGATPAAHATDTANPHAVTAAQAGAVAASLLTTAGDLIVATAASTPARLGIGSEGQALKVVSGVPAWGDVAAGGGADKWTAETAFTATPASTSTLTMTADKTADLKVGMPLRYTIGGTVYYGICTAITSGLLTVAGAPLSGSVTALAYSIFPGMVETVQLMLPGYWADSADTALILNDLVSPWVWAKAPAALVQIKAYTRTTDTGGTYPRINARIGSTTTDYVSTSNSNAGLSLAASVTWYSTVVDIDVAKYGVTAGQTVELKTDANGGNDNAADLTVIMIFVYA